MDEFNEEQLKEIVTNIKMYRVFSTNLVAWGYDEVHKILRVIFKFFFSYL